MRNVFLVLAVLMMAAPALAESTRPLKLDQPASSKSLPVKPPKYDLSCAAYGAGFVKVDGTNTCVKIGGSISVGAGTNIHRH
jgi:biopolymer transport protein ExbD